MTKALEGFKIDQAVLVKWSKSSKIWSDADAEEGEGVALQEQGLTEVDREPRSFFVAKSIDERCVCDKCKGEKHLSVVLQDPCVKRSERTQNDVLYGKGLCPDSLQYVGQFEALLSTASLFGRDEDERVLGSGRWRVF